MAARGAPPVTLRDFLDLGCDSSSDGFRSYPRCLPWTDDALQAPVRQLVEADMRRNQSRSPSSLFSFARSPSRSPSSLFSLARSPGPGALARISNLSRSFSRRIKVGFWRRRDEGDDDDLYLDDRDSCGFPSPQVSSCSASDSESEYADDVAIDDKMACPSTSEPAAFQYCDEKPSTSSSSSSSADHDCTDDGAAVDGKKKKMQAAADGDPAAVGRGSKLGMEEDKQQQLSPVSVLDFPFDDDDADERSDAGTCSPSFHRCPPPQEDLLHARPMTKQAQQLHKIRRYDGIAQAVDPVDLEAHFTTTSDDSGESVDTSTHPATSSSCTDTTSSATTAACHGEEHQSVEQPSQEPEEPEEYRLLARLLLEDTAAVVDEVSQVLLLDFFTEGLDRLHCSSAAGAVIRPRVDDDRDEVAAEALVRAASEWLRGGGPQWGIRDVMLSGKAALDDMKRGRRWTCVGEEERDVGAAVEAFVMDELVDELVEELVAPCWHGDGCRWST